MSKWCAAIFAAAFIGFANPVHASSIAAAYAADYQLIDLGSASGVPGNYGGLTFAAGSPDTLLIGGDGNTAGGAIYAVSVSRGIGGHITGFGSVSLLAAAPFIDGGLTYAPNGDLLYTAYPYNWIGQIKPGSASADKVVPAPAGSSVGSLQFVPAGFSGAGNLVLTQYASGKECVVGLTPDGSGTYNVGACGASTTTGNGPEGFVYVAAGSQGFPLASMLMAEYATQDVAAYLVDGNGLPIPGTRQVFISGFDGVEGATVDPVTGDFLFATFGGGSHIVEVQGLAPLTQLAAEPVPEPASLLLFGSGLAAFAARRRRSRQR